MVAAKTPTPVRWKEMLPWILAGAAGVSAFVTVQSKVDGVVDDLDDHERAPAHIGADDRLDTLETYHAVQSERWARQEERWQEQRAVNAQVLEGIEELKEGR